MAVLGHPYVALGLSEAADQHGKPYAKRVSELLHLRLLMCPQRV